MNSENFPREGRAPLLKRRSGSRDLRALSISIVTSLVAALLTITGGAVAANAAAGDYTVEITAPASVPIYTGFTYTVTVASEATTESPATGIILTTVLAEGLALDSAPTGPSSPVASYTYDAATRTVTFVMKDLTDQLSSFVFSVKQVNDPVKDSSTVFDTSITGTVTPSGATPADNALSTITGNMDYRPSKSFSTVLGSGNREVTYYFNLGPTTSPQTFTSWSQTLTDTIPAGAQVTGMSPTALGGSWTSIANGDGSTTAAWHRDAQHRYSSLDPVGGRIWITVNYPSATFPVGTRPPVNKVDLTVTDHSGTAFGPTSASVQGPAFADGAGQGIALVKTATTDGADAVTIGNGAWRGSYAVRASYLNGLNSDNLASLTVEDSAAQSPDNAAFFDHVDIYTLAVQFNPALQSIAAPYTLEYTTSGSASWKSYNTTGKTTAGADLRLPVQTVGSNFQTAVYGPGIEIPVGEHLTGWRVVVSPDDATSIVSGSEVKVTPSYIPSYPAISDASPPAGTLTNTATATGTSVAGLEFNQADPARFTVVDRVPIITQVAAPSTISVGSPANFVATISNLDPAGRSYADSVMKVVLPVGVLYDAGIGATPAYTTTPRTGLTVPVPGDGLTITTETVTDALGEHQVVVFTFDELPSLRAAGEVKNISEVAGFKYNIPTTVLPQAYNATNSSAPLSSWAYTNDPTYANMPMAWYFPWYTTDKYDFSAGLSSIAYSNANTLVTTAGGLLIGKLVRENASSDWAIDATVGSPGTAEWQIYIVNVLPQTVSDIVAFDRLPFVGDDRGTQFPVTLTGAVTGLPDGATVEYSTDATSATTGTWTSTAAGATAFRVAIPSLANGASVSLIAPTDVPSGLDYDSLAVNDVTATGIYQGTARNVESNVAAIRAEANPSFTMVKKTNGVEYAVAPGATVALGSPVTWTYEVTNTGNTALDDLAISDVFTAGDASTGTLTPTSSATGALAAGESRTFTATGVAVAGQYENTATATASAVDTEGAALSTQPPAATDDSWYFAGESGLTVVKTTNGEEVDSAPGLQLTPGDAVVWSYKVTNTGTLPLTDVLVEDVDADGATVFIDTIAALAVGGSVTLNASGTAITGQYHNTVTVSAADPTGSEMPLGAADDSWYFGAVPGLTIAKLAGATPDGPWAETVEVTSGDTSYWQMTVTNTGNVALSGVVLDDKAIEQKVDIGTLAPGESRVVVLKFKNTTQAFTNVATVSGTTPGGDVLEGTDKAAVTVAGGLSVTGFVNSGGLYAAALLLLAGLALVIRRRKTSTR